ncbi:MAG: DNA polymerase II [Gammaproteobacteria bacterium]|nr:DNA polymerase II [Gammaproteobacteria bacterium]
MSHSGFILQAASQTRAGACEVQLCGRLENGDGFRVRERRESARFYIRNQDAAALEASDWRDATLSPSPKTTFGGEPVTEVRATVPAVRQFTERLGNRHVPTFEADLDPAQRYLIDRDIKGGCRIHGEAQPDSAATERGWLFTDPEIEPADADFAPRTLAFDIETDPKANRLLAISLYGCGADEVYVVAPQSRPMPPKAIGCPTEAEALEAFCQRVRALDADVLTGWNIIDFDLSVLSRVAARTKAAFQLGRWPGAPRIRPAKGYFGSSRADVPGRLVLDGIALLRGAFVRMDDYSLDAVARTVLGEGKALDGDAKDRVGEILSNYANDLEAFALYARTDARLALEIVEALDLVNLAVARSRLTGMTPDRVSASIASFDFLYLAELNRRGRVAPTLIRDERQAHRPQSGGQVLSPITGLHENVWVFDFKSLYPSLIRTYNIDPLGFIEGDDDGPPNALVLANGARFRRESAILPGLLDRLAPQRDKAKRDGDAVASQAIKILMNSFYGVLGASGCRFYNPDIANAITGQGRHLLLWSKDWFEARGFKVLYGDTDSLFVGSGHQISEWALDEGPALAASLTQELADFINAESGVRSRLELEFEKLYAKLFLPPVRSGAGGARKRYAGLVCGQDAPEFIGMEVVRRDWTEFAKRAQRELYARFFRGEPVDGYLRELVAALRSGALDDQLVYRKGLRKAVGDYRAGKPPHVAAAEKSKAPPGRVIAYLITLAGPEPLDNQTAPPDREHYVHKQLRPVAAPILATLGLKFEQVIGDDRQLRLL